MSILFIISAPSGSGKSTLVNELRQIVPGLEFSISYTTRPPRGSERNGHEYFFISREEFEKMLAQGEFLEHAQVFGNYYGTARRFLRDAEAKGKDLLLDIDVQGAKQIKEKIADAVSVFILPPSREELEKRLRRRSHAEGAENEEIIQRRLHTATKEIENYPAYDYILVNDRLDQSIDELKAIVLAERIERSGSPVTAEQKQLVAIAEQCRISRAGQRLQPILASFALSAIPGGR